MSTHRDPSLTGVERTFGEDEIIVSKTDLNGKMTYANEVFLRISGYREDEVLGAPHSMLRHPEMPRIVFKRLWDQIAAGREIFAYVVNRCRNGDHYWVFAHITPTFDAAGRVTGYHSNRRRADADVLARVKGIYDRLLAAERAQDSKKAAMDASEELLDRLLADAGMSYDEFVFTLAA